MRDRNEDDRILCPRSAPTPFLAAVLPEINVEED